MVKRGWVLCVLLTAWGLIMNAAAEGSLRLSADVLTVGDTLRIEVTDGADRRAFRLERDGEPVNTGLMTEGIHAALYARVPGHYRLTVEPETGGRMTADFVIYDVPQVTVTTDCDRLRAGEPLKVNASVTGGAPEAQLEYSVWYGTERVYAYHGKETEIRYVPYREGELTVSVTVTDGIGKTATAATAPVTVSGLDGIEVTGDTQPVLAQGGIFSLTITSPGPWKATTQDDWLTLRQPEGASGDPLIYIMPASDVRRTATIVVESLGLTRKVRISQIEATEEEAEISLFGAAADMVLIDGRTVSSWLCPETGTERLFDVTASGEWQFETSGEGLAAEREGNQLRVMVKDNTGSSVRNGSVRVTCGTAEAVLGVAQSGWPTGADVLEVRLNADRGTAYRDEITAQVLTDPSAEWLYVYPDSAEPVMYGRVEAEKREDALCWTVRLPLTGAGGQMWLFRAVRSGESGRKALASISVTPEAAGLKGQPEGLADRSAVTVWTTASTDQLSILDETDRCIRTYTAAIARVDRAADETGRYVEWTLPLSGGDLPSAVQAGDMTAQIQWLPAGQEEQETAKQTGFHIHSQMDGTWHDVPYRSSNLEQSGCAIFALNHALQLMGHEEEASLPARLAKTYARCLVDGGTLNSTLIGNAGKEFGFKTRFELYERKKDIVNKFRQGCLFSFAIVNGHIALTDRLSEDGTMCHIIDSAPSATFERIKGESPRLYDEATGSYISLSSPAQIPGSVYYIDTEGYSGAEYWLPLDYVVERGVRLIQP